MTAARICDAIAQAERQMSKALIADGLPPPISTARAVFDGTEVEVMIIIRPSGGQWDPATPAGRRANRILLGLERV